MSTPHGGHAQVQQRLEPWYCKIPDTNHSACHIANAQNIFVEWISADFWHLLSEILIQGDKECSLQHGDLVVKSDAQVLPSTTYVWCNKKPILHICEVCE